MILVTLREPIVIPAARPEPEPIDVEPLPLVDEDGQPTDWAYRQATGLRFERWRAARGDFDDDSEHAAGAFAGDRDDEDPA